MRIDCRHVRSLRLEADSFCPAEYPGHTDRRVLGIGLFDLSANFAQGPPVRADTPHRNLASDFAPITVQVEVSTACHLSCVMCSRSEKSGGPAQHMPVEIWDRLLAGARHAKSVNFLGLGEPWTHPRFLNFLEQIDEQGVETSITTTGDLIDERRAALLGSLKHLRDLTFSIDSPDPDVYFGTRGQKLTRTEAGLDRAIAAIPKPGVVRVHAVVMRDNLPSLNGFPEFLSRHSVQRLVMRGVIQMNVSTREMAPDYTDSDRATIVDVKQRSERMGIDVNLLPSLPDDLLQVQALDFQQERNGSPPERAAIAGRSPKTQTKLCLDPWEKVIVTRDGDVYPCECYHLQTSVGSLATHTFAELWHGEAYRNLRQSLLGNQNLGCRSCERRGWGEHPLNRFAAETVTLSGGAGGDCEILLRNTGVSDWCAGAPVRLGTAGPRDRMDSRCVNSSWFAPNRVTEQVETVVRPGEIGTFRFRLGSLQAGARPELFQFLVEHQCWLPGAQYQISPEGGLERLAWAEDTSGPPFAAADSAPRPLQTLPSR